MSVTDTFDRAAAAGADAPTALPLGGCPSCPSAVGVGEGPTAPSPTGSAPGPGAMGSGDAPTVLLHSCCAPCSAAIIEWMLAHGERPVIYYCNPNIYPEREYEVRKQELTRYAAGRLGLTVIDGDYDHDAWLRSVAGLEHEPERGRRCLQCFRLRLYRSALMCASLGLETFTTTLASSRWKSIAQISEAGHWAADRANAEAEAAAQARGAAARRVRFDDRNWRKGGLQERRAALLREHAFYNQRYCGCEFSLAAAGGDCPVG